MKINKKTGLRTFDIEYVRGLNPCCEPKRHLKPRVRYDAVKILLDDSIPHENRLWLVLREDLLSAKALRLFAVDCARRVLPKNADSRLHKALAVATKYANGEATNEELVDAWELAYMARGRTAYEAAWASEAATKAAAWKAAWDAARAAENWAAWNEAEDKEVMTQRFGLIEMFLVEGKERLKKRKK